MNSRFFRFLALTVATIALGVLPAKSQTTSATTTTGSSPVLVYKLSFVNMGDSVNFRSYQGGYLIFDVGIGGSNTGTVILTQVTGGVRKYYTIKDYGQMFYATKGGATKAVLTGNKSTTPGSTTSGTTTSTSTTSAATTTIFMYAIGDASSKLELDVRNGAANLAIAKELTGFGIFCDSQEDLPFANAAGEDVGTAGAVSLTLKFDEGLTTFSEENNTTRTDMVTKIQTQLADQDYTNGDATTASAAKP